MYVRIQVIYQYTHVYMFWENHGLNSLCVPTTHLRNDQSVFALAVDRRSASLDEKGFRQSQRAAVLDRCR